MPAANPKPRLTDAEFAELLRLHDLSTSSLRAQLAGRTAGETLYDDLVLQCLREDKSFEVALQEANAVYPSEALVAGQDDLEEAREHYRLLLEIETMDCHRRELREIEARVPDLSRQPADPPPAPADPRSHSAPPSGSAGQHGSKCASDHGV